MDKALSDTIIDAALEVHQFLGGPGLLESIYESALCHELSLRGIQTQRQIAIPVLYKGSTVRDPLYLDILVENQAVIEVKASEKDYPFYPIQLLTHLRLANKPWGLLINFGKLSLKEGICSVMNEPKREKKNSSPANQTTF